MPGAYAHITLVNELREPQRLEAVEGFPIAAISAILDYFKFCELGAVSPDYPYLALTDHGAAQWADAMHYEHTGRMIHAGVRHLRGLGGEVRRKGLAWLLGYAAHVATDVTIHPVVELKVGPYAQNKKDHRICEMHQDAYIFQRLNLGQIGLSEHLDSGICACGAGPKRLDPDIRTLWEAMLREVHGGRFAQTPPDIDKWHSGFKLAVDDIAEEGNHLTPLARHVAVGQGLTYPPTGKIGPEYIRNLLIPGGRANYDEIFDRAVKNVAEIWALVAKGVLDGDQTHVAHIGDWNLDTGKDANNRYVFWG